MIKKKVAPIKNKHNLKIGDRVAAIMDNDTGKIIYDHDEAPAYGVLTVLEGSTWDVKWDDKYTQTEWFDFSQLHPEEKFKEQYNALEIQYNEVSRQIKENMKEAGKLLKDSNKLAQKIGKDLHDMYDALDPLLSAMDSSGWRTSSFNC